MGAQGKQAVGTRVASSSWQPRPCLRQRTAPGGRRGPPRCASICVSHRLAAPYLPPPASPLAAARGRWHQSAGKPVPGLSSQARCGRARPAVPSVCSAPPDGGAGVSPGTAAPPAHAQIFIARVVRRLMGFTIFGICRSQSWAPAGRQAGEPPSTQMNTANPPPVPGISSPRQTAREAGVEGNEVGRAQQVQEETLGKGHECTRQQRIRRGWVPAPRAACCRGGMGVGSPGCHPSATPVFCSVTARGPAVPEPGPAASLALARPGRFPCARALRIDVPATLGRSGLPRLSRSAPSRRRAGAGRLPRSARCQPRPHVTTEASCAVLSPAAPAA